MTDRYQRLVENALSLIFYVRDDVMESADTKPHLRGQKLKDFDLPAEIKLAQNYQLIKVDRDDAQFLCLNTHKGQTEVERINQRMAEFIKPENAEFLPMN
jgi:hypothetical protein